MNSLKRRKDGKWVEEEAEIGQNCFKEKQNKAKVHMKGLVQERKDHSTSEEISENHCD